jgi:hypothetical protein
LASASSRIETLRKQRDKSWCEGLGRNARTFFPDQQHRGIGNARAVKIVGDVENEKKWQQPQGDVVPGTGRKFYGG